MGIRVRKQHLGLELADHRKQEIRLQLKSDAVFPESAFSFP